MQEGPNIGATIWSFAIDRGETVYVHAPKSLAPRPGDDPQGWIRPDKVQACERSYVKPLGEVRLGRFGGEEYALYRPESDNDLRALHSYAGQYGGCIELTTPTPLDLSRWRVLAQIWDTFRPLQYVVREPLCRELSVAWLNIVSIYNYDPTLSVTCFQTSELSREFTQLATLQRSQIWSLEAAIEAEEREWKKNYSDYDDAHGRAITDLASEASFQKLRDELNRRFP
jgi:hypothetical protein